MNRSLPVLSCLAVVCAGVSQAAPCDAPRVHDLAPLALAIEQDKVVALAFSKAATLCAERGDACDNARTECGVVLTSIIQKQVGFDEGVWLRDMLLPYQGQQFAMSRVFSAAAIAPDASCNVDVATLTAAGTRRTAQATRRAALMQEYATYVPWTDGVVQKCRERMTVDEQKAAAAKVETEKLAAVAAAVTAADLAKKKAEDDAKKLAQEDALRVKEVQAKAVEEGKQRQEAEARDRADRLAAEERARKERIDFDTRAKAERDFEKEQVEEKARVAEESRRLKERGDKTRLAKQQREQLITDADAAYKQAAADEDAKKKVALEAVSDNPTVAQAAVAEAAHATTARIEAEKRLSEARIKAERIEIDDSWERARGHVGILGGGGAIGWKGLPTDAAALIDGGMGAMATAHLGLWGEAPLDGLASGLEVALALQFFQPFGPTASGREFSGHVTARYFFGPLGVGAAGEFRVLGATFGVRSFGVGPSLGIAMIDTPHSRVILSAQWLPVGTGIDLTRVVGDLEASFHWFTLRVAGGSFAQAGSTQIAWQAALFAGVRFTW